MGSGQALISKKDRALTKRKARIAKIIEVKLSRQLGLFELAATVASELVDEELV